MNCESGRSWNIAEEAMKLRNAKMAHVVTGQYDVVVYIEFPNMDVLAELLGRFQGMEGVQSTHTAVAIPSTP